MNRLFLAQPVKIFDYEAIKNDFKDVVTGRWVPMQNLHLTLHFFADKFEKEFLIERLSGLDLKADSSEIKGLEVFGENKKILFAKTHNAQLQTLHRQIQESLELAVEEFIPHITLLRIKKVNHEELLEKRRRLYDDKIIGIVEPTIQLIQSHLTPQGAQYTLLKEF